MQLAPVAIAAALAALAGGCVGGSTYHPVRDDQMSSTTPIRRPLGEVPCAYNVDRLVETFDRPGGAWGEELPDFLQDRCLSDGWTADARLCVYADDYPACLGRTLAGWQRDRLLGVVASDRLFVVADVPEYSRLACDPAADCAPPSPPTSPCEAAAQRMTRDLRAEYDKRGVDRVVWSGLEAVLLDQCRILEWPPAAATCFGERGIVATCTDQLTPKQKHDPELVIAMWLQSID
jgi:hypothetical protein